MGEQPYLDGALIAGVAVEEAAPVVLPGGTGGAPRPRSVVRNAVITFAGQLVPLTVAAVAIPVLSGRLGAARFGGLTLGWVVLGYFSLFDFGLGRAVTKLVAEWAHDGRRAEVPALVWTALLLMFGVGVLGAALAAAGAPALVHRVLNVPPPIQPEMLDAFRVLAVAIPVVVVSTGLRGVLEALERFDLVNWVRVPVGILTFAIPLAAVPFTTHLGWLMAFLLAGRFGAVVAQLALVRHAAPDVWAHRRPARRAMGPLFGFGGWMTVSNLVSPLMVTIDRFLIGAFASLAAVAYYTAPYEAITKLWVIPGAIGTVLFPAFSRAFAGRRDALGTLYVAGLKAVLVLVFPAVLLTVAFAHPILQLWLGPVYARQSTLVLQLLAVGVLTNGLAQVAFALIQGVGRPRFTALLHLAEVVPFVALLVFLVRGWGAPGAAFAWTLRVSVDAAVLIVAAFAAARPGRAEVARLVGTGTVCAALLAVITLLPMPARVAAVALLAVAFVPVTWRVVLDGGDRTRVLAVLPRRRRAVAA